MAKIASFQERKFYRKDPSIHMYRGVPTKMFKPRQPKHLLAGGTLVHLHLINSAAEPSGRAFKMPQIYPP